MFRDQLCHSEYLKNTSKTIWVIRITILPSKMAFMKEPSMKPTLNFHLKTKMIVSQVLDISRINYWNFRNSIELHDTDHFNWFWSWPKHPNKVFSLSYSLKIYTISITLIGSDLVSIFLVLPKITFVSNATTIVKSMFRSHTSRSTKTNQFKVKVNYHIEWKLLPAYWVEQRKWGLSQIMV